MNGIDAIKLATEISRIPDGDFTIAFFPCSRVKGEASGKLRVIKGCKTRTQLPSDAFDVDSENYFLFQDQDGNPKMCYKILIRYIGFPQDNYKLRKINFL